MQAFCRAVPSASADAAVPRPAHHLELGGILLVLVALDQHLQRSPMTGGSRPAGLRGGVRAQPSHLLQVGNGQLVATVLDVHRGQFQTSEPIRGIDLRRLLVGPTGHLTIALQPVDTGRLIPRAAALTVEEQSLVALPHGFVKQSGSAVGAGQTKHLVDHHRPKQNQRHHDQDQAVATLGRSFLVFLHPLFALSIGDQAVFHGIPQMAWDSTRQ